MPSLTDEQRAYVAREMRAQRERGWLRQAGSTHPEAMLLWGTIGYAAYLSEDGRVWIDTDPVTPVGLRLANEREVVGALKRGAERHGVLASLIPAPPAGSVTCASCTGSGRVVPVTLDPIWCGECDGLGWIRAGAG